MNYCRKMAVSVAFEAVLLSATATDILYENDFSTRTSAAAPRSVWAEYEYDKGGPLAYDFDSSTMADRYTGMYPWQGTASGTVPYSQQDGWFKKTTGYSRYANRGRTSVTDEADPALVHSSIEVDASVPVTNTSIIVHHPLRNVFTNGVIKFQFDVRQPVATTSKIYSWFRLVTENDLKNDNYSYSQIPIELGLSSTTTFSGGWRKNGDSDGTRTFYSRSGAIGGHWYRYYVTCDLDASRSSFEVYDLGTDRISMDAMPSGTTPAWSGSNLLFVKELDAATGGINGIGIRLAYVDTKAYYGETGFDDDAAYKYDNIKVAWKAPAASSFTECYRNDFAKSMRRTIDGSDSTSHTYTLSEQTESSTFTYPAELVRAANVGSQTGKPYLPAAFGTAGMAQKAGIDGWRFAGESGGFTGCIALTTNGANRIGMLTKNCEVLQPMCEEITNGLVKMEWDMRMPKGWNAGDGRTTILLTSKKGYEEGFDLARHNRTLTLGFCSTNGKSNASSPLTVSSLYTSTAAALNGNYHSGWRSRFKALEWYRLQLFVDLDKTNYWYNVYDIGTAAPSTPDSFDSSTATVLASDGPIDLCLSESTKYGLGIAAYGFVGWNDPGSDRDYAILFDNVRLWKGDGNDGWDLVFKNDFSTTTRHFKRRSLNLQKAGKYIDRPEYGEDGWSFMPTYNFATRIVGENPALEGGDNIFSIVQPIGAHVRSGKLYAQYDMRIPVFWTSRMNYFWFQFGNGAIASASTWKSNAYRLQNHRTMRTGMQVGRSGQDALVDETTGVPNRTAIILQDGTGAGGDGSTKAKHVNGAYVGHWIRMKIEADMNEKKWNCTAYDMGTDQPTLATADGTQLESWSNLHFNFNEPISHIHIIGGRAPSYMSWRDDAPGALLVDNIRISHEPNGMSIMIR